MDTDILRRKNAPISQKVWNEIDTSVISAVKSQLVSRKFLPLSGPHGWEFSAVSRGTLDLPNSEKEESSLEKVKFGLRSVKPLVETRICFELNIWDLDDIVRGSKNCDLENLERAAIKSAQFEQNAIFNGFQEGYIKGLNEIKYSTVSGSFEECHDFLVSIHKGLEQFYKSGILGPYCLIVNPGHFEKFLLCNCSCNQPIFTKIKELLNSDIFISPFVKDPLLLSLRGGDFEFILGQDFSVGYQYHDREKITFFITESFTFETYNNKSIIAMVE